MNRLLPLLALLVVAPGGAAAEPQRPLDARPPAAEAPGLLDAIAWPPPGNPCRPTCAHDTQ